MKSQDIFKTPFIQMRAFLMHPMTCMLMFEMCVWAMTRKCPFVVTETATTLQEDKDLRRVSASHRQGRAFDISTRDWREEDILDFMNYFSTKYSKIAAISGKGLKPQLIVRHDTGHGDHFHVQVNLSFGNADVLS